MPKDRYARIYDVVRLVPPGRVATYGQIAALAGKPGAPRWSGQALASLPPDSDVPWHRVLNAAGKVSLLGRRADYQRQLLSAEGVEFSDAGRVNLDRFQWRPRLVL